MAVPTCKEVLYGIGWNKALRCVLRTTRIVCIGRTGAAWVAMCGPRSAIKVLPMAYWQPDGTPKPQAYEVKKVYQNICFSDVNLTEGVLGVKNLFDFTDLKQFDFLWVVMKDGVEYARGEFGLSLPPHAEKAVKLDLPEPDGEGGVLFECVCLYA